MLQITSCLCLGNERCEQLFEKHNLPKLSEEEIEVCIFLYLFIKWTHNLKSPYKKAQIMLLITSFKYLNKLID